MFDDGFAIRILIAIRSKSLFKIQDLEFNFKHLTRKNLDVAKYDACISQAVNSRIYAYSWYLDAVADNWDVLVYGDYQAVMPLPKLKLKRNLWFPKIYTPPFVQQLGIFAVKNLNKELINEFIINILKLYPKIYHFNPELIDIENIKVNSLSNFELNLNQNYKTIFDGYNTNLKRKLKNANPDAIISSNPEKLAVINFIFEHANPKMNNKIKLKFSKLYDALKERNLIEVYTYQLKNELLATAFFLKGRNRIINLLPISSEKGKSHNAMAILMDYTIKKNAEKNRILDFEGSSIDGIASFFKSFGATNRPYFQYKSNSFFY